MWIKSGLLCLCLTEIESCALTTLSADKMTYGHREREKHVGLLYVDPSTWIAMLHKLLTLQYSLSSLTAFASRIPVTGEQESSFSTVNFFYSGKKKFKAV